MTHTLTYTQNDTHNHAHNDTHTNNDKKMTETNIYRHIKIQNNYTK